MEKEIVPDYREAIPESELANFSKLLEYRITITEQIKQLEQDKKSIDEEITAAMTDAGAVKVNYEGRPVSLCQGSRSTLSKEKLIQSGVSANTIKACTVESKYTYLLVGKAKE